MRTIHEISEIVQLMNASDQNAFQTHLDRRCRHHVRKVRIFKAFYVSNSFSMS